MVKDLRSLKSDYRKSVLQTIANMSAESVAEKSAQIQIKIESFLAELFAKKNAANTDENKSPLKYWGAFSPLKSEPQIDFLADSNAKSDQVVNCFPKVVSDRLKFYAQVENWQVSNFNVKEPQNGVLVEIDSLSGVFVPGVAFHLSGQRLGRGKGFYDKCFFDFKGIKVGICYDFCVTNDVPVEHFDVCMDYIITDKKIIQTEQGRMRSKLIGDS